ncbi:hypothetical protein C8Q76DRAFT_774876 [Earliella scabrosa]|nr:hypothetical protein C8Q76DRAFT_774876 [Earliella scabrosa]
MTSTDNDDPGYTALPSALKQRIDSAFDAAINNTRDSLVSHPPRKRRKLDRDAASQPGGFIVEDAPPGGFISDGSAPGGFLPEGGGFIGEDGPVAGDFLADDRPDEDEVRSHIPMALIPSALQLLDLQPDDEDVLAVFRNAATGWGQSTRTDRGAADDVSDLLVSRKDWRAVCAALLDAGAAEEEDVDMAEADAGVPVSDEDGDDVEAASDSAEEYIQSGGSDPSELGTDDDSDDDYEQGGFVRSSGTGASSTKVNTGNRSTRAQSRRTRGRKDGWEGSEEETSEGHRLSARQKRECRATFALFFPDVADEELERQRIRIKDIARVADLLKEKITAEETVEMLEVFSTAADKSMGLADFERMMIAARMA